MGTTIIDSSRDRAPLRLEEENDKDTIVVQTPILQDDDDTIVVQAQSPELQGSSGSETPELEHIEPAGEATTQTPESQWETYSNALALSDTTSYE